MPKKKTFSSYKDKARELRALGKTYSEINKIIGKNIPKSTLSLWCVGVVLPKEYQIRLDLIQKENVHKGRLIAWNMNRIKKQKRLAILKEGVVHLHKLTRSNDVGKIILAMLYWAEGTKNTRGAVRFGNSDPLMIKFFLRLLRRCYKIDELKLKCTLQVRADQDIKSLETFWSNTTTIPIERLYTTRVDPRTIGKPSKKT